MHLRHSGGHTILSIASGLALVLLAVFSPAISLATLSCNDCHGTKNPADSRPLDTPERDPVTGGFRGNHRDHVAFGATPIACVRCHPGSAGYDSSHRDGMIKLAANINASPHAATYKNRTSAFSQIANPSPGSCENVNCHFETTTPKWGSDRLVAPAGCTTCHGAPPADGSHPSTTGSGRGHADYYGTTTSCGKCHTDHDTFAHATSAGKRGLNVRFTTAPNTWGRYSGTTAYPDYLPSSNPSRSGTCSGLYCHSDGKGGAPNVTPGWGGTLPPDCTGCHGGNIYSGVAMASGNHGKHLLGGLDCGTCHNATVVPSDDRRVADRSHHLDGEKTLSFSNGGSYDAGSKSCTAIYCHSNGDGQPSANEPVWGENLPADCSGCHGGDATSARPIVTGKHRPHMNNYTTLGSENNFGCITCHARTVNGNRHIVSNRHANGLKDYSGARAGSIAVSGTGQCGNIYCHSTGMKVNRYWNMTGANWYSGRALGCTGCHGTPALPDGTFSAFTSSAGEPNYANLTGVGQRNSHKRHVSHTGAADSTVCANCHAGTVDPATAGRLRDNANDHLSGTRDVSFPAPIQGRFSSTTQQCVNTYCHGSTGTPRWGDPSLECTACHSAEVSGFSAQNAGAHGLHYQTASVPATGSYGTMAAANIGTAGQYQFTCTSCHGAPAGHASGRADAASGAAAQIYFGYTARGLKGSYRYAAGTEQSTDKGFRWSAGRCSVIYCHSDGNGGFGNVTSLAWNSPAGSLGADCSGCHGGNRHSVRPLATNAHAAHMNNDAVIGASFGCIECHAGTVGDDRVIADKRLHANRFKDYSGARAGGRSAYDAVSGQCSNVYCHSNGKQGTTAAAFVNPPAWKSGSALGCNGCHGTGNTQGAPDYVSGGSGSATANSHQRHASTNSVAANITCYVCHSETAASGTAIRGDRNPILHIDGASGDVYFNMSGAYSSGGKSCNTLYCHSNGAPFDKPLVRKDVTWGGPSMICTSCHDGAGAATALSGRHGKHTNLGTYGFSCERCHNGTSSGSTAIKEPTLHVNKVKDVAFKEGGEYDGSRGCNATYCHSDARGGPPTFPVKWSDTDGAMKCFSCHKGRTVDSTQANCDSIQGVWSSSKGYCTPPLTMSSNGHERLVGLRWIRKYPCTYCHTATVPAATPIAGKPPVDNTGTPVVLGRYTSGMFVAGNHVNVTKDVSVNPFWKIDGNRNSYALPNYNQVTRNCENVYCHSDGTTDPDRTKELRWFSGERTSCNSCHGHAQGECHDCHNGVTAVNGKVLAVYDAWAPGEQWKSSMPMFANEGVNMPRANSHPRHLETSFSCSECHNQTVINGDCNICHQNGFSGNMGETSHLNPAFHVNKLRDVSFKQGGTYNAQTTGVKSCSNTKCHSGDDPVWGMSISSEIICLSCHGSTTQVDQDDFGSFNTTKARINLTEWKDTGHGRTSDKGAYKSGNPAANFPGNPCWYCHDNSVLHKDGNNPFRLKMHSQFNNRFDHECVYCHMTRSQEECLDCHNAMESLAPQLANITSSHTASDKWLDGTPVIRPDHRGMQNVSCMSDENPVTSPCHSSEMRTHNTGAGVWTSDQKADVKNQYMMMGVCLQCHDDDGNGKCNGCHSASDPKYQLGYNPGTGYIKPAKARASSVHFGHKHYQGFLASGGWEWDANRYGTGKGGYKGTWKGGKFCWDCHDPHGDGNIFMIHDMVATETDGKFGIPVPDKRARVRFSQKNTGSDYVKTSGTIDGICNVCHKSGSQHYRDDGGDGHNASYVCTKCHEHRFSDSHGGSNTCNHCHQNKPVPRHSGFGLPRDCTKCHAGNVGARVDIMGQFKGNSHHVQGTAVTNQHCYQCHWESNDQGLIDVNYHEGYDYKRYTSVKNAKVDLVIYGPGTRPGAYRLSSTAQGRATVVQFTAANVSSPNVNVERKEVAKVTDVCISCHSDQNNDVTPFDDCKTPRQYAWDRQSIAARYSQNNVARWGKYSTATTSGKSKISKAFSAHGNAAANQGGWDPNTGVDAVIANTRAGFDGMSSARQNVQCFDCHNSHGSKAGGVTSSYVNFTGMQNGGNLKEVTTGKGGYAMTYSAKGKANGPGVVNPYSAGAGQCFDCHMNAAKGITPWGYNSTFGATQPIKGYRDALRFGQRTSAVYKLAAAIKKDKPIVGGHLKASGTDQGNGPRTPIMGTINGLCTPCHDPHGISPSIGSNRAYAIPLLKDTWLTSPYREDMPPPNPTGTNATALSYGQYQGHPYNTPPAWYKYNTDRTTFGAGRIVETEDQFAGLCLRCHPKKSLLGNYTGAVNSPTNASKAPWASTARVHASVKDWGKNKTGGEHANPCSKCHQPHNSALPRLMQTNCLNANHRGNRTSGGQAWKSTSQEWSANSEGEYRGYPAGNLLGNSAATEATTTCHSSATGNSGTWPGKNLWNGVTPW